MKNLENYGVLEMNAREQISIDGGGGKIKALKKIGKWLWNISGAADAIDELRDGFNEGSSGECPC